MAVLSVELTDDMLKLVSRINFVQFPVQEEWQTKQDLTWGIDLNSLYGGSFMLEDVSFILGIYDKHIEGAENNATGPEFPAELESYMWEIHSYILDHLQDIEEIVHQFCNRGGLKAGTYKCKSNERIWEFVK